MPSRDTTTTEQLRSNRHRRRSYFESLFGPVDTEFPPIYPHKTPEIHLLEFAPLSSLPHWTYATSGLTDPRRFHPDYLEIETPERPFELVVFTTERAPWIQAVLADLGHFCFDKGATLKHGQLFQPDAPLDRGVSHLRVALFLGDLFPPLELENLRATGILLVGLTEPERDSLTADPSARDSRWARTRNLLVCDFDRACSIRPEAYPALDLIEGVRARYRSWPRVPPSLAATLRAMRATQQLMKRLASGQPGDDLLETLADALIVLSWEVTDLRTPEQAARMLDQLISAYRQHLHSWK